MINLVPPELKETLIYARRNRMLVRWVLAFSVGMIGIGSVVLASNMYINQSRLHYKQSVERQKTQLATQKLEETKQRTEDISTSTKLAFQVLSRQVLFSELLQQVGAVMPSGAVLQSLSISKLEGALDLQAISGDYQTGTQVQINLADPENRIFDKADIVSINCTTATPDDRYPCRVSIRALFSKNSTFLFTNAVKNGDAR